MNTPCNVLADQKFGPGVNCSQFDFTLTFEQTIFGIGISSVLLLLFPVRLAIVRRASIKTSENTIYIFKIVVAAGIAALQIARLALWAKHPITQVAIAAEALELLCALAVLVLVIVEHKRTTRPSKVTSVYLLSALIADCVLLRTLYKRGYVPKLSPVVAACVACKFLLLLVESWPKTSYLNPTGKPYGPVDVAGPFNRAFLWWLNPLLLLGNRKILSLPDLYPLDHELYSEPLRLRMQKAWDAYKTKESYPLIYAMFSCMKWPLLQTVPPRAGMIAFSYAETFLITASINYLETPSQVRNVNHAYGLIAAAAIIYTGNAILSANYLYKVWKMITMFRGATSSLIYTKSLSADSNLGQLAAVTLMSTDVDRIAVCLASATDLWAQITQIALGIWLLWRQLGATSVAPTLIAVLCFLVQMKLAKTMGPSQAEWVTSIQRRIGVTSSVLRSMKSVKLAGLVASMGELLQAERIREIGKALKFRKVIVLTNSVSNLPTMIAPIVVFAAFSIEAKIKKTPPLSTPQAFTSLSILALLTAPAMMLLQSYPQVVAASGCIKRIQDFFLANGFKDERLVSSGSRPPGSSEQKIRNEPREKARLFTDSTDRALYLLDLILAPSSDSRPANRPITFEATRGTVTMIMGPVGSGKSTLLKAILGEINPKSGTVEIGTPFVGYCSQAPWLQNCSIRDNIVGAIEFDQDWYRSIIRLCSLQEDLVRMPQKDLTIVGSRGITLSGGQKHRVALARALYSRCSVLVLDDFLSSIDRKTQRSIVHNLFSKDGYVTRHGCTLLVATHITAYIHLANTVVVLDENGSMTYSGSASSWLLNNDDIATAQDHEPPESIRNDFSPEDFQEDSGKSDYKPNFDENTETIKRQKGDLATWAYYGKSIGGIFILVIVACIAITVFAGNFQKLWLQWNTGKSDPSVGRFLGIYTLFVVVTFCFQVVMIYLVLMIMGPKSAIALHKVLVKTTVKAPISFFESVDSSVLLNRFSQDMTLVDFQLPIAAFLVFMQLATCIMSIILISLGSTYMASSIPIAIVALYFVQRFYLRTSRQMRLLDLETKTPLYQHFTETLEGVDTIRAFGWQDYFDQIALGRLNDSQRPYFLLYSIQRWLSLVLGLLVAAMAVILVGLALGLPSKSSGGGLGVALTSILAFNQALMVLISGWTDAETSLGSVARTASFEKYTPIELEPEHPVHPGPDWPRGTVEVSSLSFTYSDGTQALKSISFSISAGQKFGVCGRTGSGKSTLLTSLLRLIDPDEGSISIDGIDISRVGRNTVRDRLICLPQDALVFPGSFQFNLDPEGRSSDPADMVAALESVGLWALVDRRGGLKTELKPESLSHGEQQLLALARAILRKQIAKGNCILVLDEATSNLDAATEAVVQKVIHEDFRDNTVITVAHRLNTIKDADLVLMLERGEIVQIGTPAEIWGLMDSKDGGNLATEP